MTLRPNGCKIPLVNKKIKETRLLRKFLFKLTVIIIIASLLFGFSACTKSSEPEKRTLSEPENRVASVTICASNGDGDKIFGLFNFGHAFICLTNETDAELDILGFSLPAHKTATISTWSITKKFGVWFNVESAFIKNRNKYSDRISVTAGVSESALQGLNAYLTEHNVWSVFTNCTVFSVGLFNTLVNEENRISLSGIRTPYKLKKEISRFEEYEISNEIVTEENIGYIDDGEFVGGFAME